MGEVIQVSEETLLADIERRLIDEFPCVAPAVVDALIRQEPMPDTVMVAVSNARIIFNPHTAGCRKSP